MLHAVFVFLGDCVVLGDEDDDVGAGGLEGMGQGARDIAQTARLHEGRGLGTGEGDVQLGWGGIGHGVTNLLDVCWRGLKGARADTPPGGESSRRRIMVTLLCALRVSRVLRGC